MISCKALRFYLHQLINAEALHIDILQRDVTLPHNIIRYSGGNLFKACILKAMARKKFELLFPASTQVFIEDLCQMVLVVMVFQLHEYGYSHSCLYVKNVLVLYAVFIVRLPPCGTM